MKQALFRTIDTLLTPALRRLPVTDRTEAIALKWGFRRRPKAQVIRLRSGLRFHHTGKPNIIPISLFYLGTFEQHALAYALASVGRGDTALDIGANIGFYTVELANKVGLAGRVIAVEALPRHAEAARRNLALNGLHNSVVVATAVGAEQGEVTMGLPDGGNEGMFSVGAGGDETYTVPLVRIDDIVAEQRIDNLSLIKMDIEGFEPEALKGAARTIDRFKPNILIELNDAALQRCGSSSRDLKALLEQMGYRGWSLTRSGADPLPEAAPAFAECLFIHDSKMNAAAKLGLSRPS